MGERYQLRLKRAMPGWACPYCGRPVGYVGRFFAWLLGTGVHDCDFNNVKGPHDE